MRRGILVWAPACALLVGGVAGDALAKITRIDIAVVESPALGGRSFGTVGQYERLRGLAYGEVDPDDRRHRGIVNIDRAPRNAGGMVEYSTTVEIYRPIDMSRWNRAIYHTVPNRGGAGAGDDVLLEMGFALVRVGWQGDLEPTATNIVPFLPIAKNPDGTSIVGTAREEFIFDTNTADPVTARLVYPAASLDPSQATLTVRQNEMDPRQPITSWTYLDERQIQITRPAGFDFGAIYEFIYQAKDPIVMGLGFAAMRDAISFLRYETADGQGNPNPLLFAGRRPKVAISLGISQSGRYLRDMLYQGFNEDERGRIVFDGMHPDIAGSRKTFTNYQFSQPGRWQKQHEDHSFPGDQFPFTYATLFDPISRRIDGLLVKCRLTRTCPRIVHTDGEAEIWQARSSLIVTDTRGRHIELPDNVRVYLISGTQHGGGAGVGVAVPSFGICQNLNNPMALSQIRRALTVALYHWVANGTPPPSRFPTVKNGGLVPARTLRFPDIPGVTYSGSYNTLQLNDHRFVPPVQGRHYPVFVGRVDKDGNMIDGVRHPNLAVPIGTFTGWNLRREGFAPGEQCVGTGSYLPFAATRDERRASGDPRKSLEERYRSHEKYVKEVEKAARKLVRDRYLLQSDADAIVDIARNSSIGN
ncbi:MAG TPA: alpha/beta hydrolase domain-containing protein [Thermodesulfobacteriota bacterium]